MSIIKRNIALIISFIMILSGFALSVVPSTAAKDINSPSSAFGGSSGGSSGASYIAYEVISSSAQPAHTFNGKLYREIPFAHNSTTAIGTGETLTFNNRYAYTNNGTTVVANADRGAKTYVTAIDGINVTVADGITGNAGDYALKLGAYTLDELISTDGKNAVTFFELDNSADPSVNRWSNQSQHFVFEFDVKPDTVEDGLAFNNISTWGDESENTSILEGGTLKGIDKFTYKAGEWLHLKMHYFIDTELGCRTWDIEAENLTSGLKVHASPLRSSNADRNVDDGYVGFSMGINQSSGKSADSVKAGFTIDNLRSYILEPVESDTIITPDTYEVETQYTDFSAVVTGGEHVKFLLDDKLINIFYVEDPDIAYTYTANVNMDELPFGYKKFSVVKVTDGVEQEIASKEFNYVGGYKGLLEIVANPNIEKKYSGIYQTLKGKTTYPRTIQTFDSGGVMSAHVNESVRKNSIYINPFPQGSTDESDDKSVSWMIKDTLLGHSIQNGDGLYLINALENLYSQKGVMKLEFDIKTATNTDGVTVWGLPMWHARTGIYTNHTLLNEDGYIEGTEVTYNANEWMHFDMYYDNRGSSAVWNVFKDGEHIVKDLPARGSNAHYPARLYITLNQFTTENATVPAQFWLDNLGVSLRADMPKITGRAVDGVATTDNFITPSANQVTLTLDNASFDEANIIPDAVVLQVDGVDTEVSNYTYDARAKTLTVDLPDGLTVGQKVFVGINGTATIDTIDTQKTLGTEFEVYNPVFEMKDFTPASGKAYVNLYNGTDEAVVGKLVIAAYDADGLIGVSYTDVSVEAKSLDNVLVKSLTTDGAANYKVMLWNGTTLAPIATKIEQ